MAKSFVRSANLRALVFKSQCPEVIQNCQPMFQKLVNPRLRDSLQTDMRVLSSLIEGGDDDDDGDDGYCVMNERTVRDIPRDLHNALTRFHSESTRTAQFLTHMTINGLIYTVTSKHQGNSCVLLKSKGQTQVPARIQTIFQINVLESVQTLIAIRRHLPARLCHDPFSRFPILCARVWETQLGELEIIRPDEVVSHFACLSLKGDFEGHIVSVSLSRVSFIVR